MTDFILGGATIWHATIIDLYLGFFKTGQKLLLRENVENDERPLTYSILLKDILHKIEISNFQGNN